MQRQNQEFIEVHQLPNPARAVGTGLQRRVMKADDEHVGDIIGMFGLLPVQFECARKTWEEHMQVRVFRCADGVQRYGVLMEEFEKHL